MRVLKNIYLIVGAVILVSSLMASPLTERIASLKVTAKTTDDRALLAIYHVFASDYSNTAKISKDLFFLTRDWNYLLNEGLSRSILKDPYAMNVWRDFLLLQNKERPGPRWISLAEKCRGILLAEAVTEEEAWIEEIRLCFRGKGYYTAKMLIDIYEKYGGKKDLDFLREMRAECLYRSACYSEAISIYQKRFTETSDEYYIYTQAKCYNKMNAWIESRGLLLSINDEKLKTFNYYYFLALASQGLQLDSEMKGYVVQAKAKSNNEKELALLQGMTKSL